MFEVCHVTKDHFVLSLRLDITIDFRCTSVTCRSPRPNLQNYSSSCSALWQTPKTSRQAIAKTVPVICSALTLQQCSLAAHDTQTEKHIMQIQSLELRVQTQSRALEACNWEIDALKEAAAKLQGQLDINQSCLDLSQQQTKGYLQQLQTSQQTLRFVRLRAA